MDAVELASVCVRFCAADVDDDYNDEIINLVSFVVLWLCANGALNRL